MGEPAEIETTAKNGDDEICRKSLKPKILSAADDQKPFRSRRYFLHVKSTEEDDLCRKIRKLGGSVVAVLEKVYAVVTDDPSFVKYVIEKRKVSTPNSNGGGSSVFAQRSSGAANSSSNLQQLTSEERLNKYFQKMPSVLRQAYELQLKILTLNQFRAQLAEIESTFRPHSKFKSPQVSSSSSSSKKNSVKNYAPQRLRAPFLKFEDKMQVFCPIFKEFNKEPWPRIVIKPNGRGCPFERKFNNEDEEKAPKKETDVKPRLNTRKNNQSGFCELCQSWAENLETHVKGASHRKNACSDAKYADFDALVNQGPTLKDFLSTNTSQDCDHSISQKSAEIETDIGLVQNEAVKHEEKLPT